jgi:hypothetical protein
LAHVVGCGLDFLETVVPVLPLSRERDIQPIFRLSFRIFCFFDEKCFLASDGRVWRTADNLSCLRVWLDSGATIVVSQNSSSFDLYEVKVQSIVFESLHDPELGAVEIREREGAHRNLHDCQPTFRSLDNIPFFVSSIFIINK